MPEVRIETVNIALDLKPLCEVLERLAAAWLATVQPLVEVMAERRKPEPNWN